jgi:hypothetical protein
MDQSKIYRPANAQVTAADRPPPPPDDTLASLKPARSAASAIGTATIQSAPPGRTIRPSFTDLKRKRWLFPLGGGHGAFNPTNIVAYPKAGMVGNQLQRVELYPSMTNAEQAASVVDPAGFYVSTHHPLGGQHTYNGMLVLGDQLHRLTAYATQAPMRYDLAIRFPVGTHGISMLKRRSGTTAGVRFSRTAGIVSRINRSCSRGRMSAMRNRRRMGES